MFSPNVGVYAALKQLMSTRVGQTELKNWLTFNSMAASQRIFNWNDGKENLLNTSFIPIHMKEMSLVQHKLFIKNHTENIHLD